MRHFKNVSFYSNAKMQIKDEIQNEKFYLKG